MHNADPALGVHWHRRRLEHGPVVKLVAVRVADLVRDVENLPLARVLDGVEAELRVRGHDGRRDELVKDVLVPDVRLLVRGALPRRVDFGLGALGRVQFDEGGHLRERAGAAGEAPRVEVLDEDEAPVVVIDAVLLQEAGGGALARVGPADVLADVAVLPDEVADGLAAGDDRQEGGAVGAHDGALVGPVPQQAHPILAEDAEADGHRGAGGGVGSLARADLGRVEAVRRADLRLGHAEVLVPVAHSPRDGNVVGEDVGDAVELHLEVEHAAEVLGAELRAVNGARCRAEVAGRAPHLDFGDGREAGATLLAVYNGQFRPGRFRRVRRGALVRQHVDGLRQAHRVDAPRATREVHPGRGAKDPLVNVARQETPRLAYDNVRNSFTRHSLCGSSYYIILRCPPS